jgi:hypothetical protein
MSDRYVSGHHTDSTRHSVASAQPLQAICDSVVQHLSRVDFQRAYALLPVADFLECGVRFVLTETGLRPEFTRSEFSEQDLVRARSLQTTVLGAPLPRTPLERLHALLQRCSVALMQRGQPSAVNLLALNLLYRLRQPLRRQLPWARRRDQACELLVSVLLQEPLERARLLLQRQALGQEQLRLRQQQRLGVNGPPHWPERAAYRAWLRQNPGSRILVTLHMGHYREAFHWLAAEAEPGRRVISLQRERDDTGSQRHRVDPRLQHQVLGRGLETTASVVAALRGGDTTLAILCDLGPRFGATEDVTLFGQPSRLVRGPALLAILGRAPLVPFVTLTRGGRDCIVMAPVIAPQLQSGETLAHGVQRITATLARCIEHWVRMAPEQWRFLPGAGMFLNTPGGRQHEC